MFCRGWSRHGAEQRERQVREIARVDSAASLSCCGSYVCSVHTDRAAAPSFYSEFAEQLWREAKDNYVYFSRSWGREEKRETESAPENSCPSPNFLMSVTYSTDRHLNCTESCHVVGIMSICLSTCTGHSKAVTCARQVQNNGEHKINAKCSQTRENTAYMYFIYSFV